MAHITIRTTTVARLVSIACLCWTTSVATAWQPAVIPQVDAADDAAVSDAAQQQRHWVEYYQRAAAEYKFELTGEDGAALKLMPEPVHKYTHPSGLQGTHGAFFIWTRQGQPHVVGSIWSYEIGGGKRNVVHEFHLLASTPLKPVRVGDHMWRPQSGLVRKPLDNAAQPDRNAKRRLIQMRALAREFTGFTKLGDKEVTLRMLQQPLFRYASPAPSDVDGALFGLFNEWDPEIILLIETSGVADRPWHFAAARFNTAPLRLMRAGENVWQVDQDAQAGARFGDPEGPFFAVHGVEVRDSVIGD